MFIDFDPGMCAVSITCIIHVSVQEETKSDVLIRSRTPGATAHSTTTLMSITLWTTALGTITTRGQLALIVGELHILDRMLFMKHLYTHIIQ